MGAVGSSPLAGQFVDPLSRLEQLVRDASMLDARARQLRLDEGRLRDARRRLDREAETVSAQQTELQEREAQVERRQAELWRAWEDLEREQARLATESERVTRADAELAEREERFLRRWRWLIRLLTSVRFRRRGSIRPCDVLFVPTGDGYRLLEQSGVAVSPGAVVRGLVDVDRRFEVTKVAALPLESRLCAYLQELTTTEGEGT